MKKKFISTIELDDTLLKRIKIYCIDKEITIKEFVTKAMIDKAISLKIYTEKLNKKPLL